MEVKKGSAFYKVQWFWNIVRHGLFLHGIRNRLARLGIDIMPYYWVQEGVTRYDTPEIRGDASEYIFSYFGETEITQIKAKVMGIEQSDILEDYRKGQLCIGLKHRGEIAAYMFIQLDDFALRGKTFPLKKNQSYLKSMYTFESHRGKNLAPYLRNLSYELLRDRGVDTNFSISEYFNRSTIRFKKKLGSVHRTLWLSIVLFKKYKWNMVLRNYGQKS
ncbi:GNAT family N-acetyltransferase [Flavobacteriaceae bacterium 3-367]